MKSEHQSSPDFGVAVELARERGKKGGERGGVFDFNFSNERTEKSHFKWDGEGILGKWKMGALLTNYLQIVG